MSPTSPRVSIVMTSYRRAALLGVTLASIERQPVYVETIVVEDGDDGGETRFICETYGATYLQRLSRPPVGYSNQARVINKGLKAATGDVVILQNAECRHTEGTIARLTAAVTESNAAYATCAALNADGTFQQWYSHPVYNPRPYFFCGAMTRENFLRLGGFEETFTGYGFEDDDFLERQRMANILPVWCDAHVDHLWHPPYTGGLDGSHLDHVRRERVGFVANLGREWGISP